jgi:hypothetical protein
MKISYFILVFISSILLIQCSSSKGEIDLNKESGSSQAQQDTILSNKKDDGYRGLWYMNQPLHNKYKYKYSGGMLRFLPSKGR